MFSAPWFCGVFVTLGASPLVDASLLHPSDETLRILIVPLLCYAALLVVLQGRSHVESDEHSVHLCVGLSITTIILLVPAAYLIAPNENYRVPLVSVAGSCALSSFSLLYFG